MISANTSTTNSIIEASHKTISQIICTLINLKPPTNKTTAEQLVNEAIGTAITTLGIFSPGALIFSNRDTF